VQDLLPLVVAVPLAMAAALSAASPVLKERRLVLDVVAVATAGAVAVMLAVVMVAAAGGERIYWFAGIRPHHGVALGVDFAVDGVNAGLACLTALLVTTVMIFSWHYFESVSTWFHALMLVFLAGMVGFCLTGDVFDLFVWFEVMGVAAYALTAYRPEEKGPLQGALNFAITNSVAAYLSLSGIGLVYAQTGALNMAQVGTALGRHHPTSVVVVAFLLICTGLLTKASVAPFHFWLADAHAVAPTPVCVLFSGVMVELGLYGVARVYWSMFGPALGHRSAVTAAFLALGTLTALVGAVYCYRQRHLKRLLAFSTVSHAGLFLIGLALLTPLGLAGAAVYVVGHALVKAALFLCVGIVLHRLGSIDETTLHGTGRRLRFVGVVFTLASLGLADLPPFGTFLGAGWIGDSAGSHGLLWVTAVVMIATMVVGGAVLRVAGGVFYGLGDPPSEDTRMHREASEETSETEGAKGRVPLTMLLPPAALLAFALFVGVVPHLGAVVERAVSQLQGSGRYDASVLSGVRSAPPGHAAAGPGVSLLSLGSAFATVAGSTLVAWFGLYGRRYVRVDTGRLRARVTPLLDAVQSGVVNDYVTWLVVGMACLGGALAFALR
jgi:multicomponent Na+:H+ antiporter subunit D